MIPGLLLYAVLVMPPVAAWLEGSMVGHMLVQIPLLALAGSLVAHGASGGRGAVFAGFNTGGVPGLLVALFAAAAWMLPRMLDAALRSALMEAAKFITVPLLVGAPLALSWPLLPPVARGFVWANLISHAAVLGWLYSVAPNRLCTRYLLDQQATLGTTLLIVAMALLLGWGWFASSAHRSSSEPTHNRAPCPIGVSDHSSPLETRGYPAEYREGDWTCPAPRLRSGRVMFSRQTVWRFGKALGYRSDLHPCGLRARWTFGRNRALGARCLPTRLAPLPETR